MDEKIYDAEIVEKEESSITKLFKTVSVGLKAYSEIPFISEEKKDKAKKIAKTIEDNTENIEKISKSVKKIKPLLKSSIDSRSDVMNQFRNKNER